MQIFTYYQQRKKKGEAIHLFRPTYVTVHVISSYKYSLIVTVHEALIERCKFPSQKNVQNVREFSNKSRYLNIFIQCHGQHNSEQVFEGWPK